jgi:hypothetical protein
MLIRRRLEMGSLRQRSITELENGANGMDIVLQVLREEERKLAIYPYR